jgi:surfactin synthase thioesterase subunit
MAPPMQYLSSELAEAMRIAHSFKQAAALVGMSMGAMRKRVMRDPLLKPIALACLARGRRNTGRRWRA